MRITSSLGRWIAPMLCLMVFPALADNGGRVTVAEGGMLQRPGAPDVALEKDQILRVGDTLVTPNAGTAQFWMQDDSVFALARDTSFRIDEFAAPQQRGGAARMVMSLVKGGFRMVSGLVGKKGQGTSEVRSNVATMGIRGTTFSGALCTGGKCRSHRGKHLKDGLYVKVDDGIVLVANGGGNLETPAGRISWAADYRTRAVFVDDFPEIFVELEQNFEIEVDVEVDPDMLDRIELPVTPSSPSTP